VLRQQVSLHESRYAQLEEQMREFVGNDQQLSQMVREVEALETVYDNMLARYQEALVTRELTLREAARQVWIVQEPSLPPVDTRPRLTFVAAAGLVGGLLLAFLLLLGAEALDPTVRLPEEGTEASGVPTLGTLPPLDERPS
jgi:uncharacterized protein involved in exopolysaccharide biosynthesis